MNEITIFNIKKSEVGTPLLSSYFSKQRERFEKFLPADIADSESEKFNFSVTSLVDRYKHIFESKIVQRSAYLVLGKVQSGKTAHLLGNLAWAADSSKVSFAVVFTGTVLALNNQGIERLQADLQKMDAEKVTFFEAPTSPTNLKFSVIYADFKASVQERITKGSAAPLPIFVTIKKPGRIKSIYEIKKKLIAEFGDQLSNLLIDDEADQASQNANAFKRTIAVTYGALANLYHTGKCVMLSYTATPQAIQMSEKFGKLRPDFCHVISPRIGYFGLEDVVDQNYFENLHEVSDLHKKITGHHDTPESLNESILVFIFTHLIRKNNENAFYDGRLLNHEDLSARMNSVQMLIHESGTQVNHAHVHKLVTKALDHIEHIVQEIDWHKSHDFVSAWKTVVTPIKNVPSSAGWKLNPSWGAQILEFINGLEIRVVNSDPFKASGNKAMPVTYSDWNSAPGWILIGGEILGRGLTIPQLTVSYFVRTSQEPKFDTVAQQMRFCGYRQDYAKLTHVFSTASNIELFQYMEGIDRILWKSAKRQHETNASLKSVIQPALYVSPVNSPLDPCRKSVKDPDLRDIRIGKDSEVIFSLRSIFNPIQTIENLELIGDLLGRIDATSSNGFKKYQDLDQKTFISLIRNWSGTQESKSLLRSISALYDKNLESWGLTGIPVTLFVKAPKVTEFNRDPFMESLNPIERGVNPSNVNLHLWREIALSGELNAPLEWPILKVGHVGDAQRGLKKSAGSEFLVGIIEPIRGIKTGTSESFGYGLGFTLFRPDGFEVRAISHK